MNDTISNIRQLAEKSSLTLFLTLILTLFGYQSLQAEDLPRVHVEPDNFPAQIDALNIAIEEHGGDVVYVLENGATYFIEASLAFDHPLRLEAEEVPSDNPPIIRPGTDLEGSSNVVAMYRDDLHARGIFFYGIDDLGGKPQNQRTTGEGIRLVYEHCYLMGGSNYFWWLGAEGTTLIIEDSQLANAGRHTSPGNQRFVDLRGNDTDTLIVRNTSIYNQSSHLLRLGGAILNHLYFDHVTVYNFYNIFGGGFNLKLSPDVTIKNSLFQNTRLDGAWESKALVGEDGYDYDGDRYIAQGGMFWTQTWEDFVNPDDPDQPTDADRSIVIKNNNFGGLPDDQILAIWDEINEEEHYATDPQWIWDNPDIDPDDPVWETRDTVEIVRINLPALDTLLRAWRDHEKPWVDIGNNINENVDIEDPPGSMAESVRAWWFELDPPPHYDRWDDITSYSLVRYYHPAPGNPVASEATASWFRNLAYNSDSQSYTHAENGFPVGNLNYFPEKRKLWEAGETSITKDTERVDGFSLKANYPNPFNPTTNVVFELGETAEVQIQVFDVLGQLVAVLDLGTKNQGRHEVTFDASDQSSGVYLLRMQAGDQIKTRQMTLIK